MLDHLLCNTPPNRVEIVTSFRVIVSEGASYDVRHPEQIMVMRDSVVIGVPGDRDELAETSDLVDLIHVVRLEPIPAEKAKGKN